MSSSDAVVEVKEAMTNLDLKEKAKVEAKIAMMLKLDVAKHDFQVETGSDTDAVKVVLEKAMPQDEKAPQGKKTELNISGENSENTNPSEASKKNKKKKKKPAPATAEEIGKKVDVVEKKEDVKEVLGEIGDNGGENATEVNVIKNCQVGNRIFAQYFYCLGGGWVLLLQKAEPCQEMQQTPPQVSQEDVLQ